MKKRLYILAPNDRFNYGDLLFPYIIKYYFSRYFDDIKFVSTTMSDLSEKGGIPTDSYSELFKMDTNLENHLIVAGGESLCVNWLTILSFVNKNVSFISKLAYKLERIFGECSVNFFSEIVKIFYKTKTHYVFSIGKDEIPHIKTIAYNALGGTGLLNKRKFDERTIEILSSVDYFSVRDADTSKALKKNGIKHFLCPDTAILMSEVFSEEYLQNHLSISLKRFNGKYIFFQGNHNIWRDKEACAARQLKILQEETGYKLCLCPIGTALGHSDQIALKNISMKLGKTINYELVEDPNIFDIMWLIKHAQIYIGSSLHGTITAMSFGVPFVGYGPRKVGAYIEQWTSDYENSFCNKDLILNNATKIIQSNFKSYSNKQKSLVKAAFEKMSKLYI